MGIKIPILIILLSATTFCAAENISPNVIIIVADDLGWGDLRSYGNRWSKTPNIDALAKRGILFENGYVAASVCSPSRVAIVTGRNPGELGVFTTLHSAIKKNTDINQVAFLDPEIPTIMSLLKHKGYRIIHTGKWHLGSTKTTPSPEAYGVDDVFAWDIKQSDFPEELEKLKREGPRYWSERDNRMTDHAIFFMEKAINNNQPFYLNLWFHTPHQPLCPNDEDLESVGHLSGFLALFHKDKFENPITPAQIYYAANHQMDGNIGRIIELLVEHDLLDSTIIIFVSDNGAASSLNYSISMDQFGSNGPFRGFKNSLYEGGIRVPFIASWPGGGIPKGKIDRETVISTIDLLPTLARLIGFDAPDVLSGEDMSDALLGYGKTRGTPLYWLTLQPYPWWEKPYNLSPRMAIYADGLKLLVNMDGSRMELYKPHIDSDPSEMTNLADSRPEAAKKLQGKLMNWYETIQKPALPFGDNIYYMKP